MIRDQLVEKTNSAKIQERLLMERDFTLFKAREIAQRVENAVCEAKALSQSTGSKSTAFTVNKVSRNANHAPHPQATPRTTQPRETVMQRQRTCYRCGSTQHLANCPTCPAQGKTCHKCNRTGHFSHVCRSVSWQQAGKLQGGRTNRQVNQIVEDDEEQMVLMTNSSTDNCSPVKCNVKVNGVPVTFMVDAGSTVTILKQG